MSIQGYINLKTGQTAETLRHDLDALEKIGIRPQAVELNEDAKQLLGKLGNGDTLCVCRLADLEPGVVPLLKILADLSHRGVNVRSIAEPWLDTTVPNFAPMVAGIAAFTHRVRSESTRKGLEKARSEGQRLGRPERQHTRMLRKIERGRNLYRTTAMTVQEISESIGVNRRTLYRHLCEEDRQERKQTRKAPKKN